MGSKMAAASRVVQVVKPHTPLIKFPDRKNIPKPKMQEPLQSRVSPLHASSSQFPAGGGTPSHTPFPSRIQGTPDTSELLRTLPQKYRRKPLSAEEMEYIQMIFDITLISIGLADIIYVALLMPCLPSLRKERHASLKTFSNFKKRRTGAPMDPSQSDQWYGMMKGFVTPKQPSTYDVLV